VPPVEQNTAPKPPAVWRGEGRMCQPVPDTWSHSDNETTHTYSLTLDFWPVCGLVMRNTGGN